MSDHTAYLVLFGMLACAIKIASENVTKYIYESSITNIFYLFIILIYSLIIFKWFQLHNDMLFYLIISYLICLFFPYLYKSSKIKKYVLSNNLHRNWSEKLIVTSYIYLIGSIYSIIIGNYAFGLISFSTSIGSVLYHRHKEMNYFNLDNIFATSLLLIFLYTLVSSYYYNEIYFMLGVIGLPVCIFLLSYCGMPADITYTFKLNQILCCNRIERSGYETYHNLWHISSGIGPFMAAWYLNYIKNVINIDGITFYDLIYFYNNQFTTEQILLKNIYIISLVISLIINIYGNYIGIMPID